MQKESIGKTIAAVYRNIQQLMDQLLKDTELSSGTLEFLYIIIIYEGLSQKELSEHLKIGKATTAKAVTTLVNLGFVLRKKADHDKRVNQIYLTEKAQEKAEHVTEIFEEMKSLFSIGMDDAEYTQLISSLSKVLENIISRLNKNQQQGE